MARRSSSPVLSALAAVTATTTVFAGLVLATPAVAADSPALFVSEILPDNTTHSFVDAGGTTRSTAQDNFEFFEITNTTGSAIDLAASGYSVAYTNGAARTALTVEADSPAQPVVPANGSAVFWLRYSAGGADGFSSGSPNARLFDEADFRAHYGIDPSVTVVYVAGQAGFANSGTRGLAIEQNGTAVSSSTYTRSSAIPAATSPELAIHFVVPAAGQTATTVLGEAAATPGAVSAEQLATGPVDPGTPTPTPTPSETPTESPTPSETPTSTPTAPGIGQGASGNAAAYFPLAITEIMGNNPGTDLYEYLEVTNTTDQPIDLGAAGISIRYHTSQWNAGTEQPVFHPEGEGADATVIPAGGVAVFWMNYAAGSTQRGMSLQQFRDYYTLGADVPVFRFGNQAGFANGGARGFSLVKDGAAVNRAWVEAGAIDDNGGVVQFAVPATIGAVDALVVETNAPRTPGEVTTAQVTSALQRPTDPELSSPLLQITEVAPDTVNVGGADGYEFIEIYNASDAAIDFGDYVMNYLYTDNALSGPVSTSSTLWAANPSDPSIPAGGTLVLWIKNGGNQTLTASDFNAEFGTDLVAGENLLEIQSGGFANAGSRGIQILTNTGHDVSRAYYFTDAQTTPTTAIQYAWNPGTEGAVWTPNPADGTVQTLTALASPTPGRVTEDQVRPGLVASPAAGTAPVITDLTGGSETPETPGLDLGFDVRDDVQVRTVRLRLTDNLGVVTTKSLSFDGPNRYYFTVPEADLFGKQWMEYEVLATDGFQTTSLGPVRVDLAPAPAESVRLNLEEGQHVAGQVRVQGTSDDGTDGLAVEVDGAALAATTPSLETGPVFAFEATNTDAFFRNGVKLGDDVLTIFDEGFYSRIVTVDATVPVERVAQGEPLTLTITAGTKAYPNADPNENNDDFAAMNFRLGLPDGRVLHPVSCTTTREADGAETAPAPYTCPTGETRVGFSDATLVSLQLTFDVPDDAFDSLAGTWDTTVVADGPHTVAAIDGSVRVERTVQVDNTAPSIETALVDGQLYRGEFEVAATATDGGAGASTVTATLDGRAITLPYATSSSTLAAGSHTVVFTATDAVGNTATREIAFRTAEERPGIVLNAPSADGEVTGDSATLSATATSAEADALDLAFREGYSYAPGDAEVTALGGTTVDTRSTDRSDATAFTAEELASLVGADGVDVTTSSDAAFPYQLFTVDVPEGSGDDALARVAWDGSANADAKVRLYVRTVDGAWEQVDEYLTTGGAATEFTLDAMVPVAGHAVDGTLTFLVQHSEGFAGTERSSRTAVETPYHPGATPREQYDFTIGWESDTQYYNENQGYLAGTTGDDVYYAHQVAIHDFLLENRDELNLQYMLHTGDIVDDYIANDRAADNDDPAYQWKNADAQYTRLDEAGLPYGLLAGNHDVGGASDDYSQYSTYFGAERYADNPWYGGSYKDNRGHYDLITVDGVDFLMLYMGWPAVNNDASNDEDIAWMNEVIAQFPERKVWINLHEYMLTTGGLGPIPTRVYNEVVAANPNVFAVSSGHYHDAYTRTDDFDDDGDGVADRTVYSMLFDYQGLQEGGLGFLRLLHFDNDGGRILIRTYSPSLEVFNSDDAALNSPAGMQEFEIPYAAVGLASTTKTLATDAFRADILTTHQIGSVQGAESGVESTVTWSDLSEGEHGWYVTATGPHGGIEYSEVRSFTSTPSTGGEDPGTPGGEDPGTPGGEDPGTPGGEDPGTPGGEDPGTPGGEDPDAGEQPGAVVTLSASTVARGGELTVRAAGLTPGERFQLVLHSDPVVLTSVVADASGTFAQAVTIPSNTALGAHTVQVVAADGAVLASAPLTVTAEALPATGVDILPNIGIALLLLFAGGCFVLAHRLRRRRA